MLYIHYYYLTVELPINYYFMLGYLYYYQTFLKIKIILVIIVLCMFLVRILDIYSKNMYS